MSSPYTTRSRLIEIHELPSTPSFLRQPIQEFLHLAWVLRFWPIQRQSPAELVVGVLEGIVGRLNGRDNSGKELSMRIVDLCSGAGGPIPHIEKIINQNRSRSLLSPIDFLLTDIHPHPSAWDVLLSHSPMGSLSYVKVPVDATNAPCSIFDASSKNVVASSSSSGSPMNGHGKTANPESATQRTMRTFFLAFHHFDEDGARRVLRDAMINSDAIGIFELQEFNPGSLFTITMLGLLPLLTTPFYLPFSLTTILFTYIIPVLPLILVLDGYVSAYRTRSFSHIKHLSNLALQDIKASNLQPTGGKEWVWEKGSELHTWPGGKIYWVVGRRADL